VSGLGLTRSRQMHVLDMLPSLDALKQAAMDNVVVRVHFVVPWRESGVNSACVAGGRAAPRAPVTARACSVDAGFVQCAVGARARRAFGGVLHGALSVG
jgi:hypothetical protein